MQNMKLDLLLRWVFSILNKKQNEEQKEEEKEKEEKISNEEE